VSVLLCRRYEPVTLAWLRYQVKMLEQEYVVRPEIPQTEA
jgi:hypothetical protein